MYHEQGDYPSDALLISLTNNAMNGVNKQVVTIESAGPTVDSCGDRCIEILYRLHSNDKEYGIVLSVADCPSQDVIHSALCKIVTRINAKSHPL